VVKGCKLNNSAVTERSYGLDVFRAFAIIFVLIGHVLEHSSISPHILVFSRLGILGVELFFVLSGFLIGSIIIRLIEDNRFHSAKAVASFWVRRWLRTLPLYFVILLAFIRFDYHGRHSLFEYPLYFVFAQNIAYKIPDFFELSWSLAIEEHFYLWFPIVFLIWKSITRRSSYALVLTAATFVFVAYLFRVSHPLFHDWNEYNRTIRLTVLSRIDAIMGGVLMAWLKNYRQEIFNFTRKMTPFSLISFVTLSAWWFSGAPHLMESRFLQINLFTIQALFCALLLPWFDGWKSDAKTQDFFVLTSRLSYSLYLVHILVIVAVNRMLAHFGLFDQIYANPFLLYFLYFSFFYFVSWVTYSAIEKPFLRLRDVGFSVRSIIQASWMAFPLCVVLVFFF